MKTTNLSPEGRRATSVSRGYVGAKRASTDLLVRDSAGTEVLADELLFVDLTVTDDDDGTAIISSATIVGTVASDDTPVAISTGADHRGFPGIAWLDNPEAAAHAIGDRALLVYRHGTTHVTGGKIVGRIGTVATEWTFSWGSQFDIEDLANSVGGADNVSVIDDVLYVTAYEHTGTAAVSPHVLVCDDLASSFTSASTWTRHEVTYSAGTTYNVVVGRVRRLQDGEYLLPAYWQTGASTDYTGLLKVTDPTDWSSPTVVLIATGYTENGIEEMPDGTLFAHLRDTANTSHYSSTSTDSGATWSAPTLLYAALGLPMFRRLTSGIGLTVYRSGDGSFDTAWRQTETADTDTGWGAETILDATASGNAYATILQLDQTHALVVYGVQSGEADPVDGDIYSVVFTDSTTFGTTPVLSDAVPLVESGVGDPGSSTEASRADHVHPAAAIPAAFAGSHILLADGRSAPFAFTDLLQMDDGTDFMWSDQ